MKKIKYSVLVCLFAFPFSAFSAMLVNSYLDGPKRVCVYDDDSVVYVAITARCPQLKV